MNIFLTGGLIFFNLNGLFDLFRLEKILQVFAGIFKKSGIGSPANGNFVKFFSNFVTFRKL
jgi:hypothetical protein